MRNQLEFRRQLAHILTGVIIITLLYFNLIEAIHLFTLIVMGGLLSVLTRLIRIPVISYLLEKLERPEQLKTFPGRGAIFFLVGSLLTLKLFEKDIALAAIAILTLGDSLSHLFGLHFGETRNPFFEKSKKLLEGTIFGAAAAFLGAIIFVSPLEAAVASLLGMMVEAIQLELNQKPVDDNLVIPLVAGATILIMRTYLI